MRLFILTLLILQTGLAWAQSNPRYISIDNEIQTAERTCREICTRFENRHANRDGLLRVANCSICDAIAQCVRDSGYFRSRNCSTRTGQYNSVEVSDGCPYQTAINRCRDLSTRGYSSTASDLVIPAAATRTATASAPAQAPAPAQTQAIEEEAPISITARPASNRHSYAPRECRELAVYDFISRAKKDEICPQIIRARAFDLTGLGEDPLTVLAPLNTEALSMAMASNKNICRLEMVAAPHPHLELQIKRNGSESFERVYPTTEITSNQNPGQYFEATYLNRLSYQYRTRSGQVADRGVNRNNRCDYLDGALLSCQIVAKPDSVENNNDRSEVYISIAGQKYSTDASVSSNGRAFTVTELNQLQTSFERAGICPRKDGKAFEGICRIKKNANNTFIYELGVKALTFTQLEPVILSQTSAEDMNAARSLVCAEGFQERCEAGLLIPNDVGTYNLITSGRELRQFCQESVEAAATPAAPVRARANRR